MTLLSSLFAALCKIFVPGIQKSTNVQSCNFCHPVAFYAAFRVHAGCRAWGVYTYDRTTVAYVHANKHTNDTNWYTTCCNIACNASKSYTALNRRSAIRVTTSITATLPRVTLHSALQPRDNTQRPVATEYIGLQYGSLTSDHSQVSVSLSLETKPARAYVRLLKSATVT